MSRNIFKHLVEGKRQCEENSRKPWKVSRGPQNSKGILKIVLKFYEIYFSSYEMLILATIL